MKFRSILYLSALFLLGTACKKKNDNPVINITPDELIQYGIPGNIKDWNISITSDIKLSRLIVYTEIQNELEQVYKDSALSTKNFSWKLQYLIPAAAAGKLIYFRFRVIDDDGNETIAVKEISVGDQLLVETGSFQFYTRRNLTNNAFDLENSMATTVGIADSTLRDLQEYTTDTASFTPSYHLFSPAGGKFVYANSFDYGQATFLSTKNFFEGGVSYDVTDSVATNNIYIMKLGSTVTAKYIVIKIVQVTDASGSDPDYYSFKIKK